jgi:hypothetical protein
MRMKVSLLVATLWALVPAASAQTQSTDDKTANTATVVIKTEWWEPAPSMKSAYRLLLSGYDPASEKLLGKPFGGSVEFAVQKKKLIDGYMVQRIKPGRWVFQSYSQQDKWALCFNAKSLQFEVKAGQVIYLGELDAVREREELTIEAMRSGKGSISGYGFADFFDLSEGPHLKPVDEAQLAAVTAVLQRSGTSTSGGVVAAEYSPARFGTGSTLFAERRCGGYFTKGAQKR